MRKRKPEELKDSGIMWLGNIPSDWRVKKLKFISVPQTSNVDKKSKEGETDVELCNYTDVYYNEFITHDITFMKATATKDQIKKFRLKKGDVIITKDSESPEDIAVPALVRETKENLICGYHLAQIKPRNQQLTGDFLFRLFQSDLYSEEFGNRSNGITRYGLGTFELKNVDVLLPSLQEQKAIATFLDHKTQAIDQLIEKKQQLIEKLMEKRQALITRAVTKGLNPDAPMKDSGIEWLGEIPEQWGIVRMRYLGKIDTGNKDTQDSVDGGEYPFFVRSDTIERLNSYSFDTEAVMTSGDGAGVCKIYHHYDGKFALHQRMYAIYDFKGILAKYVYYSMKANFEKEVFKLSAKSTVESLRMPMLKNFPIVLCNIDEQKRIVDYIESKLVIIDDGITNIETQIEKLKEYRQSLISATVTGKIDVRDELKELAE